MDELHVLVFLLGVIALGIVIRLERQLSGPSAVTTTLLVLCGGAMVFCVLLLGLLFADRWTQHPVQVDMRKKKT